MRRIVSELLCRFDLRLRGAGNPGRASDPGLCLPRIVPTRFVSPRVGVGESSLQQFVQGFAWIGAGLVLRHHFSIGTQEFSDADAPRGNVMRCEDMLRMQRHRP